MSATHAGRHARIEDDQDYVDDFNEAASAAREAVREEYIELSVQDRLERVGDELQIAVGARCWNDLLVVLDSVKFVVFDDEYLAAFRDVTKSEGVLRGPPGGWRGAIPQSDEIFVRRRVLMPSTEDSGNCFWKFCRGLGVAIDCGMTGPLDLTAEQLTNLREFAKGKFSVLVIRDIFALDSSRNHVQLLPGSAVTNWVALDCASMGEDNLYMARMSVTDFLAPDSNTFVSRYHADPEGFGSLGSPSRGQVELPTSPRVSEVRGRSAPASVRAESVAPGVSNVSGGVVRRQRRGITAKANYNYGGGGPVRSYAVDPGVMFNNLSEVTLDSISPDHAQEVLEGLFDAWGLPTNMPSVMKYAEDLVFTFLIATTASDKADYNREYAVPTGHGEIVVDFKVLSDLLAMKHGLTRRQFVRGLADSLRTFCRHDDNAELRAGMADRAGCQAQFATLAFDGSTHCRGLGPTERAFVKTLEARNLFEQDAVLAADASNRLLTGFNPRQAKLLG